MTSSELVKNLVIGQIHNEFIINLKGRAFQEVLGGSLLYAAGSMDYWLDKIGLIGVVGQNFPLDWKTKLEKEQLDIRGIQVLPEDLEQKAFYTYSSTGLPLDQAPMGIFASLGLPLPKDLLDYDYKDDRSEVSKIHSITNLLFDAIPPDYYDASAAHICPMDLSCHIQVSHLLHKGAVRIMTLQPHSSYMTLSHWEDLPVVVKDLTGFITIEKDLRELFQKRTDDIWEMMDSIAGYGCTAVVVKDRNRGYYFLNAAEKKRYHIPEYAVEPVDPTGLMDAYCGGFLSGYYDSYDPLRAALQGSVAVSMKLQGTGPFAVKSCIPGLVQARLEQVRKNITLI